MSGVIKGIGKFAGGLAKGGIGGLLSGGPWGAIASGLLGGLGGLLTKPQQDPRYAAQEQMLKGLMGMQGQLGMFQNLAQGTPQVDQFMNQYTQQVIDPTRAEFDLARDAAMSAVDERATQARAFGGARHGLATGKALGDIGRAQAQTIGQLQYGGYQDALRAAQQQQQFQLAAMAMPFQLQSQLAGATAMQPQIDQGPNFWQSLLGGGATGVGIWDWLRRQRGMPGASGPGSMVGGSGSGGAYG